MHEHPKKFSTQEKIDYYTESSKWLIGLPSDSFPHLKFYDEAQIAKTGFVKN
jgi:hypothetical protein